VANRIRLIGMQIDLGAGRRGVDMGPSALRVAGLEARLKALGLSVEDSGDIKAEIPEASPEGSEKLKYADVIAGACGELAGSVKRALDEGALPVTLGGDHSLAIGTLAGSSAHYRDRKERIGVIWLDAHGDFNTPQTTPSGNIHGMSFAISCGVGSPALTGLLGFSPKVQPAHCVLIGVRDLDAGERANLVETGLTVFTMREIDELGMRTVIDRALLQATRGTSGVHVSFDMDVIDPSEAPGTGTPVRGGISYREAHLALEVIADSGKLRAVDLVEINPVLDEHNMTASLGVELLCSALGKKIL